MSQKRILTGYVVVASNCRIKLPTLIEQWSRTGYELYGAPFVHDEKKGKGIEICQPMVKYEG